MDRRWKNGRYELVERNVGAGRHDLTLTHDGAVLFYRDYAWDMARICLRDRIGLCKLGHLREVVAVEEARK